MIFVGEELDFFLSLSLAALPAENVQIDGWLSGQGVKLSAHI
jgi:hypothetical protein